MLRNILKMKISSNIENNGAKINGYLKENNPMARSNNINIINEK